MKSALVLLMLSLSSYSLKGQPKDSVKFLQFRPMPGLEIAISPGPVGIITRFRNDSLSIPDSAMQKYGLLCRVYDSAGQEPWYKDKLHTGWYIPWTEMVTSGGFYIQVYRNYMIAGLHYENPGPPSILYIQAIAGSQFNTICRLLIHDSLKSTVTMDSIFSNGKSRVCFRLNEEEMGLYTIDDFYTYFETVTTDSIPFDGGKQFKMGLLGFINAVNVHLKDKNPMPAEGSYGYEHKVLVSGSWD